MGSPLLQSPGAVAADAPDQEVAAHYGDPAHEQRALEEGTAFADRSNRGVVRVSGPDRLSWLHSLLSQHLDGLKPFEPTEALLLSPNGHIEHHLFLVDDGDAVWAHVEPGTAPSLVEFLDRMRFMLRVEVADVSDEYMVITGPPSSDAALPGRTWRGPRRGSSRAAPSPTACGRRGSGRTRRCASPSTVPGSGSTPTTGRSRTKRGTWRPRST
nr:hypothetical protein [Actinomadura madurae]